MKKIVRLTESDLMRIVKNVLNEQPVEKKSPLPETRLNFNQIEENKLYDGCFVQKHHRTSLRVNCPNANVFFDVKISMGLA
jgi:hypothetical protein